MIKQNHSPVTKSTITPLSRKINIPNGCSTTEFKPSKLDSEVAEFNHEKEVSSLKLPDTVSKDVFLLQESYSQLITPSNSNMTVIEEVNSPNSFYIIP